MFWLLHWGCKTLKNTSQIYIFIFKKLLWLRDVLLRPPAHLEKKPFNSYKSIKMIYKEINWEWKLRHYYVAVVESQMKVNLFLNRCCEFPARGELKLSEEQSDLSYKKKNNNRHWFHFIKWSNVPSLQSFQCFLPFLTGVAARWQRFLPRLLWSDGVCCAAGESWLTAPIWCSER